MNNKGQVLVMFLILIPFILILFAYVIDKCYLLYQENIQKNIGSIVCNYALDNKNEENNIKQLALENDSKLEKIKITKKNDKVIITLEKNIDSILGRLLGLSTYKINTKTECTK